MLAVERNARGRDAMTAPHTGLGQTLINHLRSGQVSRVVYGSIIGLALVVTLESHPPSSAVVIGSLVATGIAVALAEIYSESIDARTRAGFGHETEGFGAILEDAAAVFLGVAFPSVFFGAAALDLIDTATAFTVAKWTGIGLLSFYGYVAGRLSGARPSSAALQALGVGAIGAALIGAKALLH
jgi:hypothetical protein